MNCTCCGQPIPNVSEPDHAGSVCLVSAEFPGLPIAEMFTRGWLGFPDTAITPEDVRQRLVQFFGVETVADVHEVLADDFAFSSHRSPARRRPPSA